MSVFSIPASRTLYTMKQDGLHILVVYSKATLYILAWVAFLITVMTPLGFKGFNDYPNLSSEVLGIIPSVVVSTLLTVLVLGFGVFKVKSIRKLFRKEKIVPWNLVEKAELKKIGKQTKVKFFLKSNNKLSIRKNTVEFFINKGNESNVERFLRAILSKRLIMEK